MKTLTFEVTLNVPRAVAWEAMLGQEGYKAWTAAFCEGSYFTGSWEAGARIQFRSPTGDGMTAEIAENTLHEYVSIRHLGMIVNGVEDTTSEQIRAWAPAYENYRFLEAPGGCRVVVTLDTIPAYEQYMLDTYPKALARLKALWEG